MSDKLDFEFEHVNLMRIEKGDIIVYKAKASLTSLSQEKLMHRLKLIFEPEKRGAEIVIIDNDADLFLIKGIQEKKKVIQNKDSINKMGVN
jgi:hypothetical protein